MKNPAVYILILLLAAGAVSARPVDFNEVSLLVRCRESESSIKQEVARRKLMHPLTAPQESTLKAQGASESLVQSLRNSGWVASKEEVAAAESERQHHSRNVENIPASTPGPRVHVFNVAFGQPINLSQWGGTDYEFAFYSYRVAGEDHIQPVMIDNVRTGTDVFRTIPLISEREAFAQEWFPNNEVRNWRYTPYGGEGDLRDNRFNFSDSVAVSSHAFSRAMHIDWENPIFIEGQPYSFYPVYGGGSVSLYFIGRASDRSATVAVVSYRAR